MEELSDITVYSQFKAAMDTEMKRSVESFVRIGYLLRKAKDTNILKDSRYTSVTEFAQAEYNIDKTQVSRFIAINERFSVDGYSDQLKDMYKRFGLSKLQEMLQLPDSMIEELSPDMTRETIQNIKKEVQEENKKTDIEVMLEPDEKIKPELESKDIDIDTMAAQSILCYLKDETEVFERMYQAALRQQLFSTTKESMVDDVINAISPSGVLATFVRISGMGKIFVTIKPEDGVMSFTNTRTNEKQNLALEDVMKLFIQIFTPCKDISCHDAWQRVYKEPFPERTEQKYPELLKNSSSASSKVAPVQQKKEIKKPQKILEIQNVSIDKSQKDGVEHKNTSQKSINAINTECDDTSTTEISTRAEKRNIVFKEMSTIVEKMEYYIIDQSETDIRKCANELLTMLDTMAAHINGDIPGQISLEKYIDN